MTTSDELTMLKNALREYLSRSSCDGRMDRVDMRKNLSSLIGCTYDESQHKIKETI